MRSTLDSLARALALVTLSSSLACVQPELIVRTSASDQHDEMQPERDSIAATPAVATSISTGPVRIHIRCGNTISTAHPPLYVVDGVPFGMRSDSTIDHDAARKVLSRIDPVSIESIEVLKELAAVARFGPGAHQGVVLITTRSGDAKKH